MVDLQREVNTGPEFHSSTIIFGADVTHPPPGEDTNPSIAAVCEVISFSCPYMFLSILKYWLTMQVVASMDWPEVTKYRGLVSAQAHREEIIQDLYKSYHDPVRGLIHSGMIR